MFSTVSQCETECRLQCSRVRQEHRADRRGQK